MIWTILKRLLGSRDKTPAPAVPTTPSAVVNRPSGDDYQNEICRWIFADPESRMMMGTVDDQGNLHLKSYGNKTVVIIPVEKVPQNDPRLYDPRGVNTHAK